MLAETTFASQVSLLPAELIYDDISASTYVLSTNSNGTKPSKPPTSKDPQGQVGTHLLMMVLLVLDWPR